MITLYWYSGCSTCKRGNSFLTAQGISPERVELKTAPPSTEVLAALHARSGLPLKKFFNTAGQSYRKGGFKDRLPTMTEAEQYEALASDGMLIKRPILDLGETVLVGFREAEWTAAL